MSLSAEAGLVLLALGLYVYDAALLLGSNELVLVKARGGWLPRFGLHGWKLGGREPFVPNLLAPWRAQVRITWAFEQGLDGEAPRAPTPRPQVSRPTRYAVTALLGLVFGALPVCLLAPTPAPVTLTVIACLYATCVAVLAALHRDWKRLGLAWPAYWKLCVECLACPPFCINAVRRATLAAGARVTLAEVGLEVTHPGHLHELRAQLARRVNEQIDLAPEDSPRLPRLQAAARRLAPLESE